MSCQDPRLSNSEPAPVAIWLAAHPSYAFHSIEAHLALVDGEGQVRWFPLEHLG